MDCQMPPTSADEFREMLLDLGLNQTSGAKLCGVKLVTAQRWASYGALHRDLPAPARRLLWACQRDRTLIDAIFQQFGGLI